jgi:hypothetical protein
MLASIIASVNKASSKIYTITHEASLTLGARKMQFKTHFNYLLQKYLIHGQRMSISYFSMVNHKQIRISI